MSFKEPVISVDQILQLIISSRWWSPWRREHLVGFSDVTKFDQLRQPEGWKCQLKPSKLWQNCSLERDELRFLPVGWCKAHKCSPLKAFSFFSTAMCLICLSETIKIKFCVFSGKRISITSCRQGGLVNAPSGCCMLDWRRKQNPKCMSNSQVNLSVLSHQGASEDFEIECELEQRRGGRRAYKRVGDSRPIAEWDSLF